MTLQDFNNLSKEDARLNLTNCCGSQKWVRRVMEGLPYGDAQSLLSQAQSVWYSECNEADWLEAFANHPQIGDKRNVSDKVKDSIHLAVGEQSGVAEQDEKLLFSLRAANMQYEAKFGFTFIVFASGKTGEEMLELLQDRAGNSLKEEMHIAMGEQWKITLLRLKKLLSAVVFTQDRSAVTTHVLDTSEGRPAKGIPISLFRFSDAHWQKIASGRTNEDGRISDLLPGGLKMDANKYKLVFNTAPYFSTKGKASFYPEIEIIFTIADDSHYHVPLLLNPFGYSTYRGS